jgi:predicted methyltransferase
MMRAGLTGVAIVALMATGAIAAGNKGQSAAPSKAAIAAALADPARADQAGDDARRKAAEVIAFSGVRPGDSVIDLLPGQGYWTRIFTGVVGPKGHVYALWPVAAAKYAAKPMPALQARNLANVTAQVLPTNVVAAPVPVDLVWTVQNYHDIPNDGVGEAGIDALNAEVFKALKPGGTYVVIDHADAAGTGMSGTSTKHRIDPAIVKAQVLKAGFKFVGASDVLRNPADDHSLKVFDPAIRGHTDQFVYKFRKPLK